MKKSFSFILLFSSLFIISCSRQPNLVEGPVEIGPEKKEFRLTETVISNNKFRLCFEFDLPGDSDNTSEIKVNFISEDGKKESLTEIELDRTGERNICMDGFLKTGLKYTMIELQSSVNLKIRNIRGGAVNE